MFEISTVQRNMKQLQNILSLYLITVIRYL